jgi:signal transduction histidine kinase
VVIPAPDPVDTLAAARGRPVVREQSAGDLSFRMLLTVVQGAGGVAVVEVLADRSAEIRTLDTVFRTLVVGGLLVLAASIVFGYLYAGRALVPIRESLRRQREFAADASHELRTPLAIVRGAADQLRQHRHEPAEVERLLGDVDAGTDRLTRLVDDLLLLARSDADGLELALETVDLGEVAGEATSGLATVAGERDVHLRLDVEPMAIRGDAALLRQLVGILLDNAIRHSPAGGTVTVRTRSAGTLDVEDSGPGIAPEHRERIFDRFWRAPGSPEGGLGLGLAIARSIVERHGGTIRALDREGGGTIFRVTLPTVGG